MCVNEIVRLINTLRPRKNGRRFADEIFVNENYCILIQISFVP